MVVTHSRWEPARVVLRKVKGSEMHLYTVTLVMDDQVCGYKWYLSV